MAASSGAFIFFKCTGLIRDFRQALKAGKKHFLGRNEPSEAGPRMDARTVSVKI